MNRLEELTLMIRRGWGDVPQKRIPDDWRDRWGPGDYQAEAVRESRRRQSQGINLRDSSKWKARRGEYLTEKSGFSPGTQFSFPFSFFATA